MRVKIPRRYVANRVPGRGVANASPGGVPSGVLPDAGIGVAFPVRRTVGEASQTGRSRPGLRAAIRSLAMLTLSGILLGGAIGANAQAAPGQFDPGGTAQSEGLPLVMLFTPNLPGAKFSAKADPNAALRVLLRDALRESGKYRVLVFQANDPVVVRALREHTLAAADVAGPISPEAMQRIAQAFGAKNLLALDAVMTNATLTLQGRLQGWGEGDIWRTIYDAKTTTALMMGNKHLKFDAAMEIAADPILTRLGLPSHMAQDLTTTKVAQTGKLTKKEREALAAAQREQAAKDKDKARQERQAKAYRERAARAAQSGGKSGAETTRKPDGQFRYGAKTDSDAQDSSAANPKNNGGKSAPNVSIAPDPGTFSAFSTDGAAGRDVLPARPDVAPPPAMAPPDIEGAIARYRQAGDMANVIASLRRAINDRPRDTLLRRQLIQAYQDRQMNDAALEETARALTLLPDDAGLRRMQGDALLAKGDMNGALAAYRDAIKRDPADVAAQVALADALLADSQTAEAQAAYLAAAKADPKSPLPHRRLANALARRAVGDSALYAASLNELKQAQALTPASDSAYNDDYTGLARLMEGRLRDMLRELQSDAEAQHQGKMTGDALKRALADLKLRGEAAADYLDKLPPAPGRDAAHAHYQQGAALLLQAVSLFREYAARPEETTMTAMKGAQADAYRELAAGSKSLAAAKPGE